MALVGCLLEPLVSLSLICRDPYSAGVAVAEVELRRLVTFFCRLAIEREGHGEVLGLALTRFVGEADGVDRPRIVARLRVKRSSARPLVAKATNNAGRFPAQYDIRLGEHIDGLGVLLVAKEAMPHRDEAVRVTLATLGHRCGILGGTTDHANNHHHQASNENHLSQQTAQ